jgi:hypothetical protein
MKLEIRNLKFGYAFFAFKLPFFLSSRVPDEGSIQ